MLASKYLQLQKESYGTRKMPEKVMKRRYEKAFEKFGTPESRKEDKRKLDEIIAEKKAEFNKEIAEIEARTIDNAFEYDFKLYSKDDFEEEEILYR